MVKAVQCLERSNAQGLTNLEFDGKNLKWLNDLAELKKFFQDSLAIKGKWTSPSGGTKKFKEENGLLTVNWYFKKQGTILLQGPEADGLQNELIKLLAEARQSVGRESNVEQESGEGINALATDGIQDKVQFTDDKKDQSVNPLAESFRDNQNINSNVCNDKCPCSCKSLATELEGIKLDIVILQSQLGIEN